MKIILVAPGHTCIPPKGWGAVEIIVWEYYNRLNKIDGIQAIIINEKNKQNIINKINNHTPDVVHIMYDDHINIVGGIKCERIIYTSHYAYLTNKNRLKNSSYVNFIKELMRHKNRVVVFAISQQIKDVYISYGYPEKMITVIHNGAAVDLFSYDKIPQYKNKAICVGKIEQRKRQYLAQGIEFIDFVGNYMNSKFNTKLPNYKGEWNKDKLYKSLTNYTTLVHLSDGEADPLVVKEALAAGLGLVISEVSTANLDLSLDFIDVIPESKINDMNYIEDMVKNNMKKSLPKRDIIRKYAIEKFSWETILSKYIQTI